MIRPFNIKDINNFTPNKFSAPDDIKAVLTRNGLTNYTVWERDEPVAFICFRRVEDDNWMGFFLLSRKFKARYGLQIKQFIDETIAKKKAKQLLTVSVDHPVIDKWHQFLGLTKGAPVESEGDNCYIWQKDCEGLWATQQ